MRIAAYGCKRSKVVVVYWSGTGNTEAMANKVLEGAKVAGAKVACEALSKVLVQG